MTPPRTDPNSERLRRLLRGRKTQSPTSPAEQLARALVGEPDPALTCAEVQVQLPTYVEAELRGIPVSERRPDMAQHLLACETCGPLYALLLDRELASGPEPLPAPVAIDLLQHEARFEEVRLFVTSIAEAVLRALRPAALPDLADAAHVFFGEVRTLGGGFRLEPSTAYALGQGGDLTPAVRFLMASFLATERLAREQPTAPTKTLAARAPQGEATRKTAFASARDSGLSRSEARAFADAYADFIATAATTLPEWPPAK